MEVSTEIPQDTLFWDGLKTITALQIGSHHYVRRSSIDTPFYGHGAWNLDDDDDGEYIDLSYLNAPRNTSKRDSDDNVTFLMDDTDVDIFDDISGEDPVESSEIDGSILRSVTLLKINCLMLLELVEEFKDYYNVLEVVTEDTSFKILYMRVVSLWKTLYGTMPDIKPEVGFLLAEMDYCYTNLDGFVDDLTDTQLSGDDALILENNNKLFGQLGEFSELASHLKDTIIDI